jgi:hypothetical protein
MEPYDSDADAEQSYLDEFDTALDLAVSGEDGHLRQMLATSRGRGTARSTLRYLRRARGLEVQARRLFELLTEAEVVAGEGG